MTLIYLHGFLSSPQSFKAKEVGDWLLHHRPDMPYHCPMLPPYPDQAFAQITQLIESLDDPVYLIGSSLGGFWATVMAERYQLPALLVNPAVDVAGLIPRFENQKLKNYHTEDTYWLTAEHSQQLLSYCPTKINPSHYWVLLQTGDETLDYRLASTYYQGARITIEEGGDHSFQGFRRFLPEAIAWFESKHSGA